MRWLHSRPDTVPAIHGVTAHKGAARGVTMSWHLRMPADIARLVIDTPPGLKGPDLADQIKGADYILIPVLPSWLDICATADFLRELIVNLKVHRTKARIGLITNKVRKNTNSFRELESFVKKLNIPVLAQIRDAQIYNRVIKEGLGIHEVQHRDLQDDESQWQSVFNWLEINAKNKSILGSHQQNSLEPAETVEKLRIVS